MRNSFRRSKLRLYGEIFSALCPCVAAQHGGFECHVLMAKGLRAKGLCEGREPSLCSGWREERHRDENLLCGNCLGTKLLLFARLPFSLKISEQEHRQGNDEQSGGGAQN